MRPERGTNGFRVSGDSGADVFDLCSDWLCQWNFLFSLRYREKKWPEAVKSEQEVQSRSDVSFTDGDED